MTPIPSDCFSYTLLRKLIQDKFSISAGSLFRQLGFHLHCLPPELGLYCLRTEKKGKNECHMRTDNIKRKGRKRKKEDDNVIVNQQNSVGAISTHIKIHLSFQSSTASTNSHHYRATPRKDLKPKSRISARFQKSILSSLNSWLILLQIPQPWPLLIL